MRTRGPFALRVGMVNTLSRAVGVGVLGAVVPARSIDDQGVRRAVVGDEVVAGTGVDDLVLAEVKG